MTSSIENTSVPGLTEALTGLERAAAPARTSTPPETTSPQGVTQKGAARAAGLRDNRDWKLLTAGSTISSIGNAMTGLTFLLSTYALTHSSAKAALAPTLFGLAEAVATLPAGALADRVNRKHLMMWSALAGALIFATIPIAAAFGMLSFPQILAVAFCEGLIGCFYSPAERGAIQQIVEPEQLDQAVSVTMARSSLSSIIGSPLAALLYGIRTTLPFLANVASFLVAFGCAAGVRSDLSPTPRESARRPSLLADMREGLTWIWRTPSMRTITLLAMVLNFAITGIVATTILTMQQAGVRAFHLSIIEAASGMAAIIGAISAPAILQRHSLARVVRGGLLGMLLLAVADALSPTVWIAGTLLALLSLTAMPISTAVNAHSMRITPNHMQGRAGSAATFVCLVAIPAANASVGFLLGHTTRLGALAAYTVVLAAITTLAVLAKHLNTN